MSKNLESMEGTDMGEFLSAVRKIRKEMGPTGMGDERKPEKRESSDRIKRRLIEASGSFIEGLKSNVGTSLEPHDLRVGLKLRVFPEKQHCTTGDNKFKVVKEHIYTTRYSDIPLIERNPLRAETIDIDERKVRLHEMLKEVNKLGIPRELVKIDISKNGCKIVCSYCGKEISENDHFVETDGILECPLIENPPKRLRKALDFANTRGSFKRKFENGKVKWICSP